MVALTEILTQRRQAAIDRAEKVASKFSDHRSATMEQQLDLEQSLDDADRYARMLDSVGGAVVRRDSGPYHPGGEHSFFNDLAFLQRYGPGAAPDVAARLHRQQDMTADATRVATLEARDTLGPALGGMIPPQYLLEEAAIAARAGAPLFDLLRKIPLDNEGVSVELGRLTSGASGGFASEGATVDSPDLVSSPISLPVKLAMAKVTETWTLFNRARPTTDLVIARDLGDALGTAIEYGLINGLPSSPSPIGLLNTTGLTPITYADASPTVGELVQKVAATATATSLARKRRPNVVLMHSRRWFWICAAVDSSLRPIVGLSIVPPAVDSPYVGTIAGLPILITDAIPTNLGVGADQDVIIVIRKEDMLVGVDDRHLEMSAIVQMPTVEVWIGEYIVFTAGRFPSGVGVLSGTGLNPVAT